MKTNLAPLEGMLLEQYSHPAFLPPLWRIIFQEAMRGNHLLFSRSLVSEALLNSKIEVQDDLVEFCVHLYAAPDLKTIQAMIKLLPRHEQIQLFHIYLRQMESIRSENKASLN